MKLAIAVLAIASIPFSFISLMVLALVLGVGHLIYETLAHQCRHDHAQRRPLDLKHAHQITLPCRPVIR